MKSFDKITLKVDTFKTHNERTAKVYAFQPHNFNEEEAPKYHGDAAVASKAETKRIGLQFRTDI